MAKGKVFVSTSSGKVVPFAKLRSPIKKDSKQVEQTKRWMTENDLVPPRYPPKVFLGLYQSNPTFWRCVNQLAIDVAGLGWQLELREDKKENPDEKKKINELFEKPNPEETLEVVLKQALVDWGSIGWFGLEIVRNNMGEIGEMYHVPAQTFRIHESKTKFCQRRNNKKVWFKKYGYEKDISSKDGKEGTYDQKLKANELIYYRNYDPESDFYGLPNVIAAIGDVIGAIGIRDYNLNFFENYGMPIALIVLEGGWDKGSDKKIADFLETEIKGVENSHRTLVVTQPENCKFVYTPLGKDVKEGSFKILQQILKENIMMTYSMPPDRIGIETKSGPMSGSVAVERTRVYIQSVVEPLQTDLEGIINNKIIRQGLNCENYVFRFTNIDIRDYETEVKLITEQVGLALLSRNEGRIKMGLKPYPEGDTFVMPSNLIEVGEAEEETG